MQRRFLLDVVIGERATILELLASENEALLVGRDALLVLDLGLDVVNAVRGLDLEGDLRGRRRTSREGGYAGDVGGMLVATACTVLPVSVFTKICIAKDPICRRGKTAKVAAKGLRH
jgi:hypothetical protein